MSLQSSYVFYYFSHQKGLRGLGIKGVKVTERGGKKVTRLRVSQGLA